MATNLRARLMPRNNSERNNVAWLSRPLRAAGGTPNATSFFACIFSVVGGLLRGNRPEVDRAGANGAEPAVRPGGIFGVAGDALGRSKPASDPIVGHSLCGFCQSAPANFPDDGAIMKRTGPKQEYLRAEPRRAWLPELSCRPSSPQTIPFGPYQRICIPVAPDASGLSSSADSIRCANADRKG